MCVTSYTAAATRKHERPVRSSRDWTPCERSLSGCVNVSHAPVRRGPCLTFRRHLPTPAYLSPKFAHSVSRSIPITSSLAQLSPAAVVRSLISRDLFLSFDLKWPICSDVIWRLMSLNRTLQLWSDWTVHPKAAETCSWSSLKRVLSIKLESTKISRCIPECLLFDSYK